MRKLDVLEADDPAGPFIQRYTEVGKEHPDWTQQEIVDAIAAEFSFPREQPRKKDPRVRSVSAATQSPTSTATEPIDEEMSEVESRPKRKSVVIRAETLLSMFQDEAGKKTDDEPPPKS